MQTDTALHKQSLRSHQLLQLKSFDSKQRELCNQFAQQAVCNSSLFSTSQSLALYHSFSFEVSTQFLFDESKRQGKKIAYPKVKEKQDALSFFWVEDQKQFSTSSMGIREPDEKLGASEAKLEEIDLMVIPGLAFDRQGNRLGRGEGYYDRTLKTYLGQRLGLAFSFQLLDQIPHEAWDEKVAWIATEKEWIEIR